MFKTNTPRATTIPGDRPPPPIAALPGTDDPVVVELGLGTGTFTEAVQQRLAGRGRHLAIELNEAMAAHVSRRCPGGGGGDRCRRRPAGSTRRAWHRRRRLRRQRAAVVGVRRAGRSRAGRHHRRVADAPTGVYTQFTYAWTRWAPPGRRQLAQLRSAFDEVLIARTVWRNMPPAVVYLSRRPRTPAVTVPDLARSA
jgi:hypothetical protein